MADDGQRRSKREVKPRARLDDEEEQPQLQATPVRRNRLPAAATAQVDAVGGVHEAEARTPHGGGRGKAAASQRGRRAAAEDSGGAPGGVVPPAVAAAAVASAADATPAEEGLPQATVGVAQARQPGQAGSQTAEPARSVLSDGTCVSLSLTVPSCVPVHRSQRRSRSRRRPHQTRAPTLRCR